MKPRLLDLFCGAGGCTKGYQEARFYVVGVDIEPQPNYCGDHFIEWDALDLLEVLVANGGCIGIEPFADCWPEFQPDAIHASPPCQHASSLRNLHKAREYPELIPPTRELLVRTGLPYVIENVEGAALLNPIMLCGSSFGLNVRRHRLFETNFPLMSLGCSHGWQAPRFRSLDKRQKSLSSIVGVHGHLNYAGEMAVREAAMQIDWMTAAELSQAIPPAYTKHIGDYLMRHLEANQAEPSMYREGS